MKYLDFKALDWQAIMDMLMRLGWKDIWNSPGKGQALLGLKGSQEFVIVVPLNKDFDDYALRMAEIVKAFAQWDDIPFAAAYYTLRLANTDEACRSYLKNADNTEFSTAEFKLSNSDWTTLGACIAISDWDSAINYLCSWEHISQEVAIKLCTRVYYTLASRLRDSPLFRYHEMTLPFTKYCYS